MNVKTETNAAKENAEIRNDTIVADVMSKPIGSTDATGLAVTQDALKIDGVMIGKLIEGEGVWVDYPGNPAGSPLPAISTRVINENDIGKDVALAFEGGDPYKPILLGFIALPRHDDKKKNELPQTIEKIPAADIAGPRLTLSAKHEIVLKCGKASITLTKSGKVLLRGAYLSSRSSGVNRIKGGSVQIN